jgi:multicomponent Na+:H+ antiporter subunit F
MLLILTCLLLLVLAAGLARAMIGPTLPYRMISVQLLATGGVATLLLMATLLQSNALIDVALILALLAAVAAAAMTRNEVDDA